VRRLLVVGAIVAAAVIALAVVAVVRSSESGDKTVQTVGGHQITRDDLELAVEHFHEEADREGRPFPAKGTGEYKSVERIALGLLIDQAAIQAAAVRLFYGVA
jgi:SurA-like N-terminal domain